jgi:hypothetical protein
MNWTIVECLAFHHEKLREWETRALEMRQADGQMIRDSRKKIADSHDALVSADLWRVGHS